MRKIFIDCGAHNGSSVRFFSRNRLDWQEYEIFSFEPDPQHWNKWPVRVPICDVNAVTIDHKEYDVIKKAVWIEDTTKDFYITEANFRPEGGSTLNCAKDIHNKLKYQTNIGYKFETIQVTCIDINKFINGLNIQKDDYVIMKLDVEGAEYDIIPYMIQNKTFEFINEFFIEWHNWRASRCPRPSNVHRYKSTEDLLYEQLIKDMFNLDCKFWDAIDY